MNTKEAEVMVPHMVGQRTGSILVGPPKQFVPCVLVVRVASEWAEAGAEAGQPGGSLAPSLYASW